MLAGLALKDLQDELDADVHIIGTPDEEDDGAKCIMADMSSRPLTAPDIRFTYPAHSIVDVHRLIGCG